MTNEELARNVAAELAWDPKVDGDLIDVVADDGEVLLRGTVGSFRQKREAQKAAERVHGVTYVDNIIDVKLLTEHKRADAELRADVLHALTLDSVVPPTVDADVTDGSVLLTGTADWQYQREEAGFVAGNVRGVVDVDNDIYLNPPIPYEGDVRASIAKALDRDAKVEARTIGVETLDGTAVLTGSVRSWAEHDAVVAAAWAAPGVTDIDDKLTVQY
jgi:osmotically-inducible protein OsmY